MQRAKEILKIATARATFLAKADSERANEDVKLRILRAEAEQKKLRNIAAVTETFKWVGAGIRSSIESPREVLVIIMYLAALATALYIAKEAGK
jgi:hypothetical protein